MQICFNPATTVFHEICRTIIIRKHLADADAKVDGIRIKAVDLVLHLLPMYPVMCFNSDQVTGFKCTME